MNSLFDFALTHDYFLESPSFYGTSLRLAKYIKTSLAMGLVAGVGAAMLGHAPPLAASMHYRESRYDGAAASQKFRYLKSLEHREAREAARLAELDALREFQD